MGWVALGLDEAQKWSCAWLVFWPVSLDLDGKDDARGHAGGFTRPAPR